VQRLVELRIIGLDEEGVDGETTVAADAAGDAS
jgi:hypothetical protein